MPDGCDISEHQGDLPPEWFDQWEFCIIRAFNENGYPDVRFAQNWARAKGRTRRGVYGWPILGAENVGLGEKLVQAAPDAEFGYWADVEHSARGIPGLSDIEYYLIGIGPRLRGFYSNIGECPRSAMLDQEHWWMADYGPNDGTRHDPFEQPPVPQRGWTIHQYSSGTGLDLCFAPSLDFAGQPAPGQVGDMLYTLDEQTFYAYVPGVGFIDWVKHSGIPYLVITQQSYDRMAAATGPVSPGGGLSEAQTRKIIREEIDRATVAAP